MKAKFLYGALFGMLADIPNEIVDMSCNSQKEGFGDGPALGWFYGAAYHHNYMKAKGKPDS